MAASRQEAADTLRHQTYPCKLCLDKSGNIDYKDVMTLRRYLSEDGKILPRRLSGNCAEHQREVTLAIKRSREIGMVG